jgi:hypothetical protein
MPLSKKTPRGESSGKSKLPEGASAGLNANVQPAPENATRASNGEIVPGSANDAALAKNDGEAHQRHQQRAGDALGMRGAHDEPARRR